MAIDATAGGSAANSYATAAEAKTYAVDRNNTTWTGLSPHVQEANLIKATDYLERRFTGRWAGAKATDAQALAFPRVNLLDVDGYAISSTVVPEVIKRAQFEAAFAIASGIDLEPTFTRGGQVRRKKVKAGPVETETEYSGAGSHEAVVTAIDRMLKGYLNGFGAGTIGLLRA